MEGGIGWWKQITEAIDQVEFMIMVLTPAALSSDVARKEWRYARQQGVRVCPVMGVPPDQLDVAQLPSWMRKTHFYDLEREWATFVGFLNSARRDNRVPFMAPDLRVDFVSRPKEFDSMLSALLDTDHVNPVVVTTALQGAGGFGKTTLAIALCHHDDVITAFDDGILWATLGEAPKIQHELTKLYAALTGERPSFLDVDDAAIHLAERLDQKNCLIVIDDVWDANHVVPFLRGGKQCSRLITTRRLDVISETQAHWISVDEMTADQSIELLKARLPLVPADVAPLRALARRLGEWPLLLKLAASQLRERLDRGDSFEGALAYVNMALQRRGPVAFDRANATERSDAVGRTVRASLELLSPTDRTRCAELAIFPEGITVPLSAIRALWQLDQFETEETVQRLDAAALVDFDLKVGAIRVHNVLQEYLRTELTDAAGIHRRLVKTGWPDLYSLPDSYAWRWLSWHLLQAGDRDQLRLLLGDYKWIDAKLRRSDVQALLLDFDLLDDRGELRAVHDAIRLASHGLARDPEQLAAQITGRLPGGDSSTVDKMVADAARLSRKPSLRLRHTSLTHAGGALNGILKGHTGSVEAVAVSVDGSTLLSGAADWTLRVWDLGTGRTVKTLTGHTGPILCVAFTADSGLAISGSEDRSIRVWHLDDGRERQVFRGHMGAVHGVAISPDGRTIASISEDKTVRLCDLTTGKGRVLFTGHSHQARALAWMPDGQHLVLSPGDETVVIMSVADGRIVTTCRGHDSIVRAVAATPDGRRIVSGSSDRTVRVFDATSGEQLGRFDGHADQVECLGITKDARIAVSGALDGTLRSWDLETIAPLAVFEGHASFVRSLAITPDDSRLISGSSDKTIRHWTLDRRPVVSHSTARAAPVAVLAISANGLRAISAARESDLSVWDVERGAITRMLAGHEPLAMRKAPRTRLSGLVTAVNLSEDGSRAVSASRDATLRVWDVVTGETLHTVTGHSDAVLKVALTPNGRYAASLSRDRTVRVWNLAEGRAVRALASEDNLRAVTNQTSDPLLLELGQGVTLDISASPISRDAELDISPDGRYVVIGDDSGVLCWDVKTGRSLKEQLDDFIVVGLAMGLPGHAILGSRTGWIKVWNLETCTTTRTIKAHERQILDLAINTDQQRLVSAGRDNTIRIWRLSDLGPVGTLEGTSPGLDEVALAPDTRIAYSIHGDTIVAADLMRLAHFGSLSFDHQITVLAVAADGTSVAAGDESGMVHFVYVDR